MTQSTCFQHPDTAATTRCGGCDKSLCVKCATFEGGKDRCADCIQRYHQGKKTRAVVVGAVLGLAAVGAGTWLVLRPAGEETAPEAQAFDYGKKDVLIRHLRKELSLQPCDKTKGREYAQALFDAGDLKGTIQAGDDFIAKCGKSTALRQLTYTAHVQLQEFDLAARDVTELIEGAPNSANYFIWRGMAYDASSALDKAAADFRQAFLLKPAEPQVTNLLATAAARGGKDCEARLAVLEHLQARGGGAHDPKMLERLEQLSGASNCGTDGQGRAELSFPEKGPRQVEARAGGGVQGRFLVDTDSARVVLSKAFAEKLALPLEGAPSVRLQAGHDILTVRLAKVSDLEVQGAKATNVEVAVADTLPEGADGLLGLSFLARFDVKEDAKAGRMTLSERAPAPRASAVP
ncbi:retropepsin-like aspartic protease [Myxococcus sp. RHSTA-1-4]|uniref:retropepsin-like aspartic protease n=1 Tax=Myxococcus sp. RHSTA-1-4 TaxID=2874601 RepID=UPI001CBF17C9|nr:retropepsin-like aspartic protease [Myxococcus sp. RHSTA-1-4]MBZ4419855.1 retroviral-like aspartic protease family protein [Myxococcus sp. RHSTA-1-4]